MTILLMGISSITSIFVAITLYRAGKKLTLDRKQRTVEFFTNPQNSDIISGLLGLMDLKLYQKTSKVAALRVTEDNKQTTKKTIRLYLALYELFSIGIEQKLYDFKIFFDYNKKAFVDFEYPIVEKHIIEAQKADPMDWINLTKFHKRVIRKK